MRVIGVVDLLAGQAVQARRGQREHYLPVVQAGGSPVKAGSAVALAEAYFDRLGLKELYVADLDAIIGRAPQDTLVSEIAALGAPLCLDAGVTTSARARHALDLGATTVVVGLETLTSYDALEEMCSAVGGEHVAFSLDLRDGQPVQKGSMTRGEPSTLAVRAVEAGVRTVIVLDLARVGTGRGIDCRLLAEVRQMLPQVTLLAGGGVKTREDLDRLADAGCDGALVATSFYRGELTASDVAAADRHHRVVR